MRNAKFQQILSALQKVVGKKNPDSTTMQRPFKALPRFFGIFRHSRDAQILTEKLLLPLSHLCECFWLNIEFKKEKLTFKTCTLKCVIDILVAIKSCH